MRRQPALFWVLLALNVILWVGIVPARLSGVL